MGLEQIDGLVVAVVPSFAEVRGIVGKQEEKRLGNRLLMKESDRLIGD